MQIVKKSLPWLRDAAIFAAVIYAIIVWQSKDLLDDDGSVSIEPMRLVSLNDQAQPVFEQGRRTLIYFFAPWCKICEVSINNLDHLQDDSLNIVRVALDYSSKQAVARFVNDNQVRGRVLFGTEALKQQFNVPGYPTYYLLNEERQVVGHSFGYSTALGLKVKNLLNK